MRHGRPRSELFLSPAERDTLVGWVRASCTPQALAQRALIVLACASGASNASVAAAVGASPQTVGKWRQRFVEQRQAGLSDAPRSGAPPRISPGDVAWVLNLTLLAAPRSSPRWSARSVAEVCGMSPSSVLRIWRAFGLRPGSVRPAHCRADARKRSRFEDLAFLYVDPERRARVRICRAKRVHGLRGSLTRSDVTAAMKSRAEMILCEEGASAGTSGMPWRAPRPRFGLHFAPRGPLWTETVCHWFAPDDGAEAPPGLARVEGHIREAVLSGEGFAGGGGAGGYVWSASGERFLEAAAALL